MLAWRNVQYAAGIGAEFLLRMLQRQAWLVVGYDDSLPVGFVVAVSTHQRTDPRLIADPLRSVSRSPPRVQHFLSHEQPARQQSRPWDDLR